MSFAATGLMEPLLKTIAEQGYTEPTPIQARAIPAILAGRDVLAAAQTGTGKTAAFTLPILHRLAPLASHSASPAKHPVRVLILTPTRELADQITESVRVYGKNIPLKSGVLLGGVPMPPQIQLLRSGIEIVVATPGRLCDHLEQKTLQLNQVELFVLDEADRMLDMGFIADIRHVAQLLPARHQTLLFSATFSKEIRKMAEEFQKNPEIIEVARQNATNANVEQKIYAVDGWRKKALLTHLCKHEMDQAIIFCRTRQSTERLSRELQKEGLSADAIHGDKNQQSRMATLAAFKAGKCRFLVATDVAARGLDIDELPHVVNFELPGHPEDYVHRIGRTGRGGKNGIAISLVEEAEERQLKDIESLLKTKFELSCLEGFALSRFDSHGLPRTLSQRFEPLKEKPKTIEGRKKAAPSLIRRGIRFRAQREIPALLLPPRYPVQSTGY